MKIFEKIKIEKEREIRIFGIAVLQYGKKIISGGIERYVKLFPTSFEDKTLKRILKDIPEQYDDIWIIRTAGLGEAQLLNFAFDLTENNVCVLYHIDPYMPIYLKCIRMFRSFRSMNLLKVMRRICTPEIKNSMGKISIFGIALLKKVLIG